jgi:hypothetical protein
MYEDDLFFPKHSLDSPLWEFSCLSVQEAVQGTLYTYTECCPKRVPNKKKPALAPSLFFHHGFWSLMGEGEGGGVIPRLLTVTIFCWSNPLQTEITPLWALELLYPRIASQWALKLHPSCILPSWMLKKLCVSNIFYFLKLSTVFHFLEQSFLLLKLSLLHP